VDHRGKRGNRKRRRTSSPFSHSHMMAERKSKAKRKKRRRHLLFPLFSSFLHGGEKKEGREKI